LKDAWRKYLKTNIFYYALLLFTYVWYCFLKCLQYFYAVKIVYICVFIVFYISCCLCDTIMDPWNVCCYVCMYAKNLYVNNNNKFLIQSRVSAKWGQWNITLTKGAGGTVSLYLVRFYIQKLLSVDIKERKKRLGFSASHFTLSRKTALSGIPKMPNILNQFQNKRTMTEVYQE